MTRTRARIFASSAAILACGALALFPGCKGSSAASVIGAKPVGPPPAVTVLPAAPGTTNPGLANPMTDKQWIDSTWYTLVAPANTTQTTPTVQAAMMYDAKNLYVAFLANTVPPPSSPVAQDFVSIYLDTTPNGNGSEMAKISVSAEGKTTVTQIEYDSVAYPKDDGSPDKTHPFATFPNRVVPGLAAKTLKQMQHGSPVWTAVITIPIGSLPRPLSQKPAAGLVWKVNLLRSINTADVGSGVGVLQANLSPVYAGLQDYSPYRLATLTLGEPPAKK